MGEKINHIVQEPVGKGTVYQGLLNRDRQIQQQVARDATGGAAVVTPPADTSADESVDQLMERIYAEKEAKKLAEKKAREDAEKAAAGQATPPTAPATPPPATDQQSFNDPNFRRVYRAPNGVLHDLYGPAAAQQGLAFHGGPGIPVSGSSHPAFIGTSIPETAGLVEYRVPRNSPLQQRLLADNGQVV